LIIFDNKHTATVDYGLEYSFPRITLHYYVRITSYAIKAGIVLFVLTTYVRMLKDIRWPYKEHF